MRLAAISVSVLTVGALALFGCSTSSDKEQPVSNVSAVQGGDTDSTHKFAVGVCDGTAPGRCQGICSGALILPNLVATARHCVSKSPELINCQDNPTFGTDKTTLYVTTNTSMFGGSGSSAGWYKSKKIFRPADNHVCGNDIALIQLENSVPDTEAKPITPNIQHQMWDSKYFVPSFTAIGYGRTAPANGQFAGEGTRRILGQIDVRCIPGSPTIDCPQQINEGEFVGGDGICQGDSGSSAYDQASFDAEAPVSFGVLSRGGSSPDGTQCQGSLYSRFDAHRDFVLAAAKEASENWTKYPQPEWTGDADPAPGSKPGTSTKKAAVGETCKKSRDCASGKCVQDADGTRTCAKNCSDDESVCGRGEVCSDGACMPKPEETSSSSESESGEDVSTDTNGTLPASEDPKTVTTTTSACSFSSGSSSSSNAWLLGLGLAVATVSRRRRRA
jgi:MYXO-CTERM domain-containing protein